MLFHSKIKQSFLAKRKDSTPQFQVTNDMLKEKARNSNANRLNKQAKFQTKQKGKATVVGPTKRLCTQYAPIFELHQETAVHNINPHMSDFKGGRNQSLSNLTKKPTLCCGT